MEISHIINKIGENEGRLRAVIAHSFGAASVGKAINEGLSVEQFISIAAPTSLGFIINSFCSTIGASTVSRQGLVDKVESILGESYENASLVHYGPGFKLGGLTIHDRKDRVVPFTQAEQFSSVWPGSKLITTEGLGHSRILRNKKVIDIIVEQLLDVPDENLQAATT